MEIESKIIAGQSYQFVLCASPVNVRRSIDKRSGERTSVAIEGRDRLKMWLKDRLVGADVRFCQVFEQSTLTVISTKGRRIIVPRVEFKGILYVSDRNAFIESVLAGPGKGKCWGCGLVRLNGV